MRFLVLFLALAVITACGHHRRPPPAEYAPPVTQLDPPTAEHCAALIRDLEDHMKATDFNKDRKSAVTKAITKARAEQAAGRFDKCVNYAKKAIYWSR